MSPGRLWAVAVFGRLKRDRKGSRRRSRGFVIPIVLAVALPLYPFWIEPQRRGNPGNHRHERRGRRRIARDLRQHDDQRHDDGQDHQCRH